MVIIFHFPLEIRNDTNLSVALATFPFSILGFLNSIYLRFKLNVGED